jgi:AcrR family transcriptional regulator
MCGSGGAQTVEVPQSSATLGRADWIEAALEILADDGVEAVRITRLAARLDVTRGSFYWHFKDRDDLLSALIAAWERRNTKALIGALEASEDLIGAVLAVFEIWMRDEPFAPRLDAAMREWARRSPAVRRVVERADETRVKAISRAFERAGFATTEAFIRARILYFTQVGYYALEVRESLARRIGYVEAYIKGFTGLDLNPARAAVYRRRFHRAVRRGAEEGKKI